MRLMIFLSVGWLLSACDNALPHRLVWELDPQSQGANIAATDCQPPRQPFYIYPDGVTPFYLECLRGHTNE